jgi:5'-nucleotidase
MRVQEVKLADDSTALATDGAPSDCVSLALLGLLDEPVDLVVSGINPFANLGHDLTYSGTVTAAMEAAIWKLPAVAVSLNGSGSSPDTFDFSAAGHVAQEVVRRVIEKGLPPHTLLSVNVPYLPLEQIKGYSITRQGMRIYKDELARRVDPRGVPYYWIGGEAPGGVVEDGTDFGALNDDFVSITPVQLDLTAYGAMKDIQSWNWPDNGHSPDLP